MVASFIYQMPTKVHYGLGQLELIGDRIREIGGSRVLIVTDRGVKKAPFMIQLYESLEKQGIKYTMYTGIEPNPAVRHVEEGLEEAKSFQCNSIIGIGGGSSIDGAKAIAVMMENPGKIGDYWGNPPKNQPLPLVAVPTTAGTSSEVTWVTVIKDEDKKVKMGINSPLIAPRAAIYDPSVTIGVPPDLTASIGMDALTHAVESFINKVENPPAELAALEAIRLIGNNLRQAVADGENMEARNGMMLSTLYAGIAFANQGLGVVHAITAVMGGVFPVSHGVVNAILLPTCMKFNMKACPEKFAQIAGALGENLEELSIEEAAAIATNAVARLSLDVGIPSTLEEVGVKEEALEEICQGAIKNVNIPINPRQTDHDDLMALCKQVM